VPHVEQELFTLPEHMNSHPDFSKVRVAWYLMFCVVFYWSLFVLFLFLLAIVLSVFLWITFTFGYCIVCISLNYFFFWPLYCLSFFELLLPITPLVSSNYTWDKIYDLNILFICFTWHRKCFQKKQTVYWLYSKIIALISDNYIDIWLLHCYLIIALIYDYYIDIWLLHWYLIIALISDYCIDIWLLHWYLIITLISDYCIDIWLLHWYLIIALISDYCIDIWLLHWYLIIALISDSKFKIYQIYVHTF
jgi:hypothetical protein